jgi:hypothetical protein
MNMLENKLKNIPNEVWNKLIRIDELKGQWIAGAKLDRQVLGRLKQSVLITSTGASTRIEGAMLSDKDVEKLMKGVSIQKWKDRDKQEVKGYYELLHNVFDAWGSIRFSENSIKHFHREMLKYVEKDKLPKIQSLKPRYSWRGYRLFLLFYISLDYFQGNSTAGSSKI